VERRADKDSEQDECYVPEYDKDDGVVHHFEELGVGREDSAVKEQNGQLGAAVCCYEDGCVCICQLKQGHPVGDWDVPDMVALSYSQY
jgi:hypothetical protein